MRTTTFLSTVAALALKAMVVQLVVAGIFANTVAAQTAAPQTNLEGQFSGYIYEECNQRAAIGLEVNAVDSTSYRATLYSGGLPEERSTPVPENDTTELDGTYDDHTLRLTGDTPLTLQFIHGRYTVLDEENNYVGHLERVLSVQPDL